MKLEEKITLLRKQRGWSQEELGFRLDVSRQAVSKWEMGDSVPDLDKIIKMSEIFGCSTDSLLKDEIAVSVAEEKETGKGAENEKCPRQVYDEEGENYLALVKKQSWKIAIGVACCILSPICMFALLALSAAGCSISEDAAAAVGTAVLLVICACGVSLIVVGGVSLLKYEYLGKEEIVISERLRKLVQDKKSAENNGFIAAIAVGVALCILSIVPMMLFVAFAPQESNILFSLVLLLVIVSVGVFLFVKFGVVYGGNARLLQEGDYTVNRKRVGQTFETFSGIYWGIMVAIYLAFSFWTMAWHKTWIVWPIAGVLFAVIEGIFKAFGNKKEK